MKHAVTVQDLDERRLKAAAFDEALAYLEAHAASEEGVIVLEILRKGQQPEAQR